MINTDQVNEKSVHTHSGLSWRSTPVSGDFEVRRMIGWFLVSDEEIPLPPLLCSPGFFGFLGPSRPDLVMHRLDDVDSEFGGDMWFLWDE